MQGYAKVGAAEKNSEVENATQNGGEFKALVCELFQLKSHG